MAKASKPAPAQKKEKKVSPSGYVATQAFTQHLHDGTIDYAKGQDIPADIHPNTIGKYLAAGLIEKPEEEKEED